MGSIHFINDEDPYFPYFWENKTVPQAEQTYFEEMLTCLKLHDDFDVLGHLTYAAKQPHNPGHTPVLYEDFRELIDEILIHEGGRITIRLKCRDAFEQATEYIEINKNADKTA